jgi:hypothetical protein
MTADLVAFLRERLDEDEAIARAAEGDPVFDGTGIVIERNRARGFPDRIAGLISPVATHIARHDPARVLADIAAKRAIVDEHAPDRPGDWDCRVCADEETYDEDSEGNGSWTRSAKSAPCRTLRLLAAPYAGADSYRPGWGQP